MLPELREFINSWGTENRPDTRDPAKYLAAMKTDSQFTDVIAVPQLDFEGTPVKSRFDVYGRPKVLSEHS